MRISMGSRCWFEIGEALRPAPIAHGHVFCGRVAPKSKVRTKDVALLTDICQQGRRV